MELPTVDGEPARLVPLRTIGLDQVATLEAQALAQITQSK